MYYRTGLKIRNKFINLLTLQGKIENINYWEKTYE